MQIKMNLRPCISKVSKHETFLIAQKGFVFLIFMLCFSEINHSTSELP